MNPHAGQVGRLRPWSSRETRRDPHRMQKRGERVMAAAAYEPRRAGARRRQPQSTGDPTVEPAESPDVTGDFALALAPGPLGPDESNAADLVAILLELIQFLAELAHLFSQLSQLVIGVAGVLANASPHVPANVGNHDAAVPVRTHERHVVLSRSEPHRSWRVLELRVEGLRVSLAHGRNRQPSLRRLAQGLHQIVGVRDLAIANLGDDVSRLE